MTDVNASPYTPSSAKPTPTSTIAASAASSVHIPSPLTLPHFQHLLQPAWMTELNDHDNHRQDSVETEAQASNIREEKVKINGVPESKGYPRELRLQTDGLDTFEHVLKSNSQTKNIDSMNSQDDQGIVFSRKKRAARGSSRGGSSRGGSRGGSHGSCNIHGSSTGRYYKVGPRLYKEFVKSTPNYFTGNKWYDLNGTPVDLHKSLMYTKFGNLKSSITTTKGMKYKIDRTNNWLKIKTNNQITINTLPKIVQYKHRGNLFNLAICNLHFNNLWNNPLGVHFLFHNNNNPFKLLFAPSTLDASKLDIGYYETSTDELATSSTNNTAIDGAVVTDNSTTGIINPNKKFIKIASIPKGNNVSFAVLNKQKLKTEPNMTPTSASVNNTTAAAYNSTASNSDDITTAANPTQFPTGDLKHTNINDTSYATPIPVKPFNSTNTEVNNNITRINSLLSQEDVSTDAE